MAIHGSSTRVGADLSQALGAYKDFAAQVSAALSSLKAQLQSFGADASTSQKKAAGDMAKVWDDAGKAFGTSFTTAFTGLVMGTETWQKAVTTIFDSVAKAFIQDVGEMIAKWLAFEALGVGGGSSSGGGLLGAVFGGIGSLFGDSALDEAVPSLGALAALDTGAWSIPRDMIALVHQGEMVIPAEIAQMVRSGGAIAPFSAGAATGASAAPTIVFAPTVTAIDSNGVATFLRNYGYQIAQTVNAQLKVNPSMQPKLA